MELSERARLVAVIDFAQPESYLALGPTLELARDLGLEIEWRGMTRPVAQPAVASSGESDRGARHRQFRARYREMDLRRYAAVQGLDLGDLDRHHDSRLALGVLAQLRENAPDVVTRYVERVFAGFWAGTLDIEDPRALDGVVASLGRGDLFAHDVTSQVDPDRLQAEGIELRAAGVVGTPAYLVDGQVFLGRAHLPMIRWLVGGRAGRAPI